MDNIFETLDLSNKKLKKLNKPSQNDIQVTTLILDDNEFQRLDNIDSYLKVQKLSAVRNQLLRMYGVCRLQNLVTLNLAYNGILTIEGLKELVNLKCLNLSGNNIKTIEHLNNNINLEHLDISENSISHIVDLSFLKGLKELLLHNNKIGHLRQCERFLPTSLITLTLASNNITDLNEISQLVNLTNLNSISLANNPCVTITGNKIGFDYRPFIINWCMNVRVIDGYVVDALESLKGEWLYSQGRGRHFRIGDQDELTQYLASACPLSGEQLETEEDRKLRLILSKAQQHQQQLRDQGNSPIPSPVVRKKIQGSKYSPRISSSRLSSRSKSPDKMSSSCYSTTNNSIMDTSCIMTQSLDLNLLNDTNPSKVNISREPTNGICLDDSEAVKSPLQALSKLVPVPESLMSPDYRPSPLSIRLLGSGTIPTPTSNKAFARLMQPSKSPKLSRSIAKPISNLNNEIRRNSPSPVRSRLNSSTSKSVHNTPPSQRKPLVSALKKSPSTDDESEICDAKLQTIQQKVEEKRLQKDAEVSSSSSGTEDKTEMAAIFIQKMWRGFYTRNRDKKIQDIYKTLQSQRADEYLAKLTDDMQSTKAALESERKIQMLQMQAINALWKKVSSLQPENGHQSTSTCTLLKNLDKVDVVNNLAQTCTSLQSQIQQLQSSMEDIVKCITMITQNPSVNQQRETAACTQTEIVAVHTPQGEAAKTFPFQKQTRPSSLPLPINNKTARKDSQTNTLDSEVRQFAGILVDGVIRNVSEIKPEVFGMETAGQQLSRNSESEENYEFTNEVQSQN